MQALVRTVSGGAAGGKRKRSGAKQGGGGKFARVPLRNVPTNRIPRSVVSGNSIYPFKRTVRFQVNCQGSEGFQLTGGGIGYGMGITFCLDQIILNINLTNTSVAVPNSQEFINLFDQWRIHHADVKYVLSNNTSAVANTTLFLPTFVICNDEDDGTAPAGLNEMLQRPDHQLWQMGLNGNTNNVRKKRCYPQVAAGAFQAGLTSAYTVGRRDFINCSYPATQCYGQKIYWDTPIQTNQSMGLLVVYVDLYYEFKGVR